MLDYIFLVCKAQNIYFFPSYFSTLVWLKVTPFTSQIMKILNYNFEHRDCKPKFATDKNGRFTTISSQFSAIYNLHF